MRSPSPRATYDAKSGQKTNGRDVRLRDKYVRERQRIILQLIELDPSYRPPADFKPPKKYRKVMIPTQTKDGFINYVGQVIGPGGATQKRLEKETKCKIQLRGEGSDKVQRDYMKEMLDGPQAVNTGIKEEALHVHLTADTEL